MKWIKLEPEAQLPTKAHETDAAWDLRCLEPFSIEGGQTVAVKTGIGIKWHKIAIDPVTIPCGLVLPRSGLASKEGITVLNSPGLIDYGYEGDLTVVLHKAVTQAEYKDYFEYQCLPYITYFNKGDRIAQIMFTDVWSSRMFSPELHAQLGEHDGERKDNGFGSTGIH